VGEEEGQERTQTAAPAQRTGTAAGVEDADAERAGPVAKDQVGQVVSSMLWFMLSLLLDPVVLLFTVVPLGVLGAIYGWASFRIRKRHGVQWAAARIALIASWLSLLGWTVYVLHAIALSRRGTAILGIITIPSVGIPLAVVVLAVVWGVSVVLLSLSPSRLRGQWPKRSFRVASGIVVLTSALCGVYAYSALLQTTARTGTSPEGLRTLYERWWARHDTAVLGELASNTHTPPDVLAQLASHHDAGIRYDVARNPGTPAAVLEQLYDEPYNRTSLAVNPNAPPTMLRRLATDPDQVVRLNLLFNRSLPFDVLEELAKDPAVSNSAAAELRRRREPRHWAILAPPYTWKWLQPCTAVFDDTAPIDQWSPTAFHAGTQQECETLRSEIVRREQSPARRERLHENRRSACEYASEPPDLYSHTRCAYGEE